MIWSNLVYRNFKLSKFLNYDFKWYDVLKDFTFYSRLVWEACKRISHRYNNYLVPTDVMVELFLNCVFKPFETLANDLEEYF